ncbi:unnamed protein product [Urochloa humidicola]
MVLDLGGTGSTARRMVEMPDQSSAAAIGESDVVPVPAGSRGGGTNRPALGSCRFTGGLYCSSCEWHIAGQRASRVVAAHRRLARLPCGGGTAVKYRSNAKPRHGRASESRSIPVEGGQAQFPLL